MAKRVKNKMLLEKHCDLIRYLGTVALTRRLLDGLPTGAINALSEIFLNIRLGSLELSKEQQLYFDRRQNLVKKLSSRGTSAQKRRKLLKPSVIKAAIDAVLPFLNGNKNETRSGSVAR